MLTEKPQLTFYQSLSEDTVNENFPDLTMEEKLMAESEKYESN